MYSYVIRALNLHIWFTYHKVFSDLQFSEVDLYLQLAKSMCNKPAAGEGDEATSNSRCQSEPQWPQSVADGLSNKCITLRGRFTTFLTTTDTLASPGTLPLGYKNHETATAAASQNCAVKITQEGKRIYQTVCTTSSTHCPHKEQ